MYDNDKPSSGNKQFIGKKLYKLRRHLGLSQLEMGKIISVSHQQIHRYEQGENMISAADLSLIAKVTKTNIEFFFPKTLWKESVVNNAFTEIIKENGKIVTSTESVKKLLEHIKTQNIQSDCADNV